MEGAEYQRGKTAGSIDERLSGHDKHFAAINGHLATLATQAMAQTLALQRLVDAAAITKDAGNQSWTRWQRLFAVISAAGVVVAIYLGLKN